MKKCTICKETKSYDSFAKMRNQKDGYNYWCKPCVKVKRADKDWHINQYGERKRIWEHNRQNTDLKYKLISRIRSRINHALNGRVKDDSLKDLLGCDMNEYKIYLEKRFDQHMTWDNYGKDGYWEIDHTHPLSKGGSFHYTNTQPLSIIENREKGDKILC